MSILRKLKREKQFNYQNLPAIVFDENPIKIKNQSNSTKLSFIYLMQIK
jgi:hypothetical protein